MERKKPVLLIVLNSLLIIAVLFICLTPFLADSGMSWLVSIAGMVFPYLLALMIVFLVIWIIRFGRPAAKYMVALNFIVLLLSVQQIRAAIAFNFFADKDFVYRPEGIRVMSWNVSGWDSHNWDIKNKQTFQPLMFDLIDQTAPDVLLLQEFFNSSDPELAPSYLLMLAERGFPHYYFSPHSITIEGKFQSGLAIFSRYPMTDTAFFFPESAGHAEGFQRADIHFDGTTYRFFNTHLESAGMDQDDVESVGKVKGSRTLFNKLKYSHIVRMGQARMLKSEMNNSPHPVVLGGDLGELPNSTTYFYLRSGMKDAFIKKGSGIGRTFPYIVPNLRIDYLFVSRDIAVETFHIIPRKYSVHYPIISDISD